MDIAERVAQLRRERVPHAVASVIRARDPSSAKPGDRAVITPQWGLEGWVGGSCAEGLVRDEGARVLASGFARYVVLDSEAEHSRADDDRVIHPMACVSGGAMEIFIEPYTPPTHMTVVGDSPVATAVAAVAGAAGCDVAALSRDAVSGADAAIGPASFVVVATMGRGDEEPAAAALAAGAPYVAVVASRRRAGALREWLDARGVAHEGALHSPAGLDLGARTPEGVAVSIVAEVVATREQLRAAGALPVPQATAGDAAADAVDTVPEHHACH
jgi:xanthine dehydrogenase accessory factor